MCGRFTRMYTWAELYARYKAFLDSMERSNLQPRYNVCPTTKIDVIRPTGNAQMRWGLIPSWWSKPLKEMRLATFNARSETVDTKPFFRQSFKSKRCLLPLSGYYEWQTIGKEKQPWYFTAADGELLTAAGLWDEWKNPETGEVVQSCTMLITEPNAFVAEVHDRMPVLLTPDKFDEWLNGKGKTLLKPAPEDFLKRHRVSKRVNSSRADDGDATLIDPV